MNGFIPENANQISHPSLTGHDPRLVAYELSATGVAPDEKELRRQHNLAKNRVVALARYRANREAILARRKELRSLNPELEKSKTRLLYKLRRERLGFTVVPANRLTAEERIQRRRESYRQWRARNIDRVRLNGRIKKAVIKAAGGPHVEYLIKKKSDYDKMYREKKREERRAYKADIGRRDKWNKIRREKYRLNPLPKKLAAKKWRMENAVIVKQLQKQWGKTQRSKPYNRLVSSLYTRVYAVLHGRYKSAKTMELIGCDRATLRDHIER